MAGDVAAVVGAPVAVAVVGSELDDVVRTDPGPLTAGISTSSTLVGIFDRLSMWGKVEGGEEDGG